MICEQCHGKGWTWTYTLAQRRAVRSFCKACKGAGVIAHPTVEPCPGGEPDSLTVEIADIDKDGQARREGQP